MPELMKMTAVLFGVTVLIMAVILVAEYYRRRYHRNQQLRWLDAHPPMRDWMHHK